MYPIGVSITLGMKSLICHSIKLILILLSIVCIGCSVQAVERQPIILMANKGLFFYLHMAINDSSFLSTLKPEEKQMADEVYAVLEKISALRWFNENQIASYPFVKNGKTVYLFAYVDGKDQITRYDFEFQQAPKITFSSDRQKFTNLKKGEGERVAKTNAEFTSPIEFNLYKLNELGGNEIQNFDLGKAVSLLIHEYGHKLGPEKENLEAIYSIGNKLGDYIRARVNYHPLKTGTNVYSLYFDQFKFHEWMGEIKAPTVANHQLLFRSSDDVSDLTFSKKNNQGLPVFANQGIYVWAEQSQNFLDLTDNVQKKITIENLLKQDRVEETYYRFIPHRAFSVKSFQVKETQFGEVAFKVHFAQVEVLFPFMVPDKSKPPQQIEFNKRYFWSNGRYIFQPQTTQLNFKYSGSFFQFQNKSQKSDVLIDAPFFSLEAIEKKIVNDELVLKLKVLGPKLIPYNENRGLMGLAQAEVGIQTDAGNIKISSDSFDKINETYTFRISQVSKIALTKIKIKNLFLKTLNADISDESYLFKAEVPLFEPIEIDLNQKSMNIQAALFKNIEFNEDHKKLKLLFESFEELRSVSLRLRFHKTTFSAVHAHDDSEKLDRKQTDNITAEYFTDVDISAKDLKQSRIGPFLSVEIDLDKLGTMIHVTHLSGTETFNHKMVKMIHANMSIQKIGSVTESLKLNVFRFEKDFNFSFSPAKNNYQLYQKLLQGKLFEDSITRFCKSLF